MLVHYEGAELFELFQHLPDMGNDNDFEAAGREINKHFDPQLNPDYERFKLRQTEQLESEAIDVF